MKSPQIGLMYALVDMGMTHKEFGHQKILKSNSFPLDMHQCSSVSQSSDPYFKKG